jgi:large subunit ribosomal protein L18
VAVYRSLNQLYLQVIDDDDGRTLASASSLDPALRKQLKGRGGSIKAAEAVGAQMAKSLKAKGLKSIVFDRGGFVYHGRIKAAAEAIRKGGISF